MAALDIAGTIVGAATASAGLILVFIGATTTAFEGYHAQEKRSVRSRYQKRANFAFGSLLFSMFAVFSGLLADWMDANEAAVAAFIFLVISLFGVVCAAYSSISEIR